MEDKKEKNIHTFKGRYLGAVGKRKTSAAQVRLYKTGTGVFIVNGIKANKYFTAGQFSKIMLIIKMVGQGKEHDFSVEVRGGGKKAQADAVILGIARTLIEFNKDLRPALKAKGWLTRDSRRKERKKPGLKKARRAPQWAKR